MVCKGLNWRERSQDFCSSLQCQDTPKGIYTNIVTTFRMARQIILSASQVEMINQSVIQSIKHLTVNHGSYCSLPSNGSSDTFIFTQGIHDLLKKILQQRLVIFFVEKKPQNYKFVNKLSLMVSLVQRMIKITE